MSLAHNGVLELPEFKKHVLENMMVTIARTIADLDGSMKTKSDHVAEAIQYRSLDRRIFR